MDVADTRNVPSGRRAWITPLLGVAFVLLLLVGILVGGSTPSTSSTGAKVISFYHDHRARQRASAVLTIVSIPVGLFFFGLLREYLHRSPASRPYATIAFAGSVVFAVGGCTVAGILIALTDNPLKLTPEAAQALNVAGDLPFAMIVGGLSALHLGYGIAILRSRLLPTWLGWLGIVIGVVALLGPIGFVAFIASGIWVLMVCGLLYPRLAKQP